MTEAFSDSGFGLDMRKWIRFWICSQSGKGCVVARMFM